MLNALFAGMTGIQSHQTRMNVIGNNIANVNTVGFKYGRANFRELLAQNLGNALNEEGQGGVNPMQFGLGTGVASIDNIFAQGTLESTGLATDLAVQGDGFFVLSDGETEYFTRAGAFTYDGDGHMVNPTNGYYLQGRLANVEGQVVSTAPIEDIVIPWGQKSAPVATTSVDFQSNLDSDAAIEDTHATSIVGYDSLGDAHTLQVTFTKSAQGVWNWEAALSADEVISSGNTGTLTFKADGTLDNDGGASTTPFVFDPANGADPVSITFDFGTLGGLDGVTQLRSQTTTVARSQNGHNMGKLETISIDTTGLIVGIYSNGTTENLARIVLAHFDNPGGLSKAGDNMYAESSNSGQPIKGTATEAVQGTINAGFIEMSNVDLAKEFSSMIIAQRGLQANTRTVTTANDILGELVNLKR